MKTKQKLVLSLAALSAITLGVGATSTFAWFTTTRTASVAVNNIGVYGTTGSLRIGYFNINNGNKGDAYPDDTEAGLTGATGADKTTISFDSAVSRITPISGDGSRFFSPTWLLGKEGVKSAHDAKYLAGNTSTDSYMVQFGIFLSNTGSTKPLNVYFDYGTAISPATAGTAADIAAAKASRVSFTNFGTSKPTTLSLGRDVSGDTYADITGDVGAYYTSNGSAWAKKESGVTSVTSDPTSSTTGAVGDVAINTSNKTVWSCLTTANTWVQVYPTIGSGVPTAVSSPAPTKWLVSKDTTDATFSYMDEASDYTAETADLATIDATKVIKTEVPTTSLATEPATGATSKTCLCTIAANSFQYLGVSLWIEGASANCTNDANKGSVSLALKLAAF